MDAVLVAGDAFDANAVARRTLMRMLDGLKEFSGDWVFIPGNHDPALAHSVWTRLQERKPPANVHLALQPEQPLPLAGGRAVVLPAVLQCKHEIGDLTAWFDHGETPEGAIRIGLAHGSVPGYSHKSRNPSEPIDNPVSAKRADDARLDYLALGHLHGTLKINDRTWYAGTPETDRFSSSDPGNVLVVTPKTRQIAAAVLELQDLLRFSRPGSGAAKEKHRGLAALLWVEQGCTFEPLNMNQDSQAVLREAIEGEVGQVLGGERDRQLLKQVEEHWKRYFTPTGLEKRDGLISGRQRVEELKEALGNLRDELQTYGDKVNRLGELKEKLARDRRDDVLAKAKEEFDDSNAAIGQLEAVEGRLKTAKAQMDQAKSAKELAEVTRERRKDLANEVEAFDQQARKAEGTLKDLEPDYGDAEHRLTKAEEQLIACKELQGRANEAWDGARQALERARLADELQKLDRQFQQAKSLSKKIERKQQEVTSNPVDEDYFHQLQNLHEEQIRLESALEAAAATLVFSLEGGQSVLRDGSLIDAGQPVHVTRTSTFHLHGFGTLDVTPGKPDLAEARDKKLAAVKSKLGEMLCRLEVVDLASAEAAFLAKRRLEDQVKNLQGQLTEVAPQGLAVLETQRAHLGELAGSDRG
ncbi:metallophosphoesterase family protein, partial [Candidatus Synechococcus spongiarum]